MFFISRILRPTNSITTCPPGKLFPGKGPLVLVASLKRSGTHLLIDAILNNFSNYKRKPLLVNLDPLLDHDNMIDRLIHCGGYVVKTHYPQVRPSKLREKRLLRILQHARVLIPERELDATFRSSVNFGAVKTRKDFLIQHDRFQAFWNNVPTLRVPFERLVDREHYPALITEISSWLGIAANAKVNRPFRKEQRPIVYTVKFLTRILGYRCPIVNTTIGFAKKQGSNVPYKKKR